MQDALTVYFDGEKCAGLLLAGVAVGVRFRGIDRLERAERTGTGYSQSVRHGQSSCEMAVSSCESQPKPPLGNKPVRIDPSDRGSERGFDSGVIDAGGRMWSS